ncbi:unnamed protein product, partial [Notodromas monacha]
SIQIFLKQDRLWRKTRSNTKSTTCKGVDANRNFPFHWKEGRENNAVPCEEIYPGDTAESEPCIKHFINYVSSIAKTKRIVGYISFHSYGKYWLVPYAYTTNKVPNYAELMDIAKTGAAALKQVRGTQYGIGIPGNVVYAASGSSMDWAYGAAKIPYVFTLELPPGSHDSWANGFLLSATQIKPVSEETFVGIMATADAINKKLKK